MGKWNIAKQGGIETLAFDGTNLYAGSQNSHVYRYQDESGWVDIGSAGNCVYSLLWIAANLYAGNGDGGVYRYTGGKTWQDTGLEKNNSPIWSMATDGTNLYAASENGEVHKYLGNNAWEYIGRPGRDENVRAIAWCNGRLLIGTCDWTSSVYQYQGNATWKDLGVQADRYISEVASDESNVYFGTGDPKNGGGGVYRLGSDNSWTKILSDVDVNSLIWNGSYLIAGTSSNVLRYDGSTWKNLGSISDSEALCWNSSDACLYADGSGVVQYCGPEDVGHK